MRLVRHLSDMPFDQLANGSVVTIGAYDGLHLGHRQLLDRVLRASQDRGLPSVVMSFEPMPREFFSADNPPARLMRFREKFAALASFGIDIFYCPRFGKQIRSISADAFIRRILIHGLNTRHLVVGDDFQFARRREGSIEQLLRVSDVLGYTVEQVPSVIVDDIRVSSSAIREALWGDDTNRATRLLGRPYQMSGKVVMGDKLGRTLGFPTANVDIRRRQSAVMGVFAVRVAGLTGGPKNAVANVGIRPTFNGIKPKLEVHIFDFDETIYGEHIHVEFIARLRGEKKFAAIDDLVAQMRIDADNARSILSEYTA
jgi:riboflavin kinase/FMN adenylyltransferase